MEHLEEKQKKTSNKAVDWAKHYDYYEIELRNMYKTVSRRQNESHYKMLEDKGAAFLNKKNSFCEIGFGCGLTLRYAFKDFGFVYGLDISPKNIELTKQELRSEGHENFDLFVSDLMNFDPRFENKFDVISFIHGLEHFSAEDYPVIFGHIKKYLKPGGVFTGALPFRNVFTYRMCPECNHVFEIDGHVSSHNIESLTQLFKTNGFEIIHVSNINMKYALSHGSLMKKAARFVYYGLLKAKSHAQLEYIVRPKK